MYIQSTCRDKNTTQVHCVFNGHFSIYSKHFVNNGNFSIIIYTFCHIAPPEEIYWFLVLYDFLVTVKAAPHKCVIRTGQPLTKVKAENEAWFYSK